jgi:hypothetical protein
VTPHGSFQVQLSVTDFCNTQLEAPRNKEEEVTPHAERQGVHAYIDHTDITGNNKFGAVIWDEEIFCSGIHSTLFSASSHGIHSTLLSSLAHLCFGGPLWEWFLENRRYSRNTHPKLYITEYFLINED